MCNNLWRGLPHRKTVHTLLQPSLPVTAALTPLTSIWQVHIYLQLFFFLKYIDIYRDTPIHNENYCRVVKLQKSPQTCMPIRRRGFRSCMGYMIYAWAVCVDGPCLSLHGSRKKLHHIHTVMLHREGKSAWRLTFVFFWTFCDTKYFFFSFFVVLH